MQVTMAPGGGTCFAKREIQDYGKVAGASSRAWRLAFDPAGAGFRLGRRLWPGARSGLNTKGLLRRNSVDFHNAACDRGARRPTPAPPPVETWWTGFRDPVLTRIVERALEQNLDLAAAIARVEQARAAAREAGAQLLPTGSASGSATPLRQSLNSPIGTIGRHLPGYERNQTLYDADVGAQWEIDLIRRPATWGRSCTG